MTSKPDMAFLIRIGAVKLPDARKYRKVRLTSTEYSQIRRAKFAAQGLNSNGKPPKKGGPVPRYGIDWKTVGHRKGMRLWRAAQKNS